MSAKKTPSSVSKKNDPDKKSPFFTERNIKPGNNSFAMKDSVIIPVLIIVICIIAFLVFSPALNSKFKNWDDNLYVTKNNMITSLSPSSIIRIFTSFHESGNYHPLTMLSLAFDYSVSEMKPFFYNFHNIILHIINSILLFFLFRTLSQNRNLAIALSIIFCVHPLRVESVVWVSERKDLLYSMFYISAMLTYLRWANSNDKKYYFISLLLFILSLFAKSMAVTLPVVLILLDDFLKRKISLKTILEKIPFFIFSLIFGIVNMISQREFKALSEDGGLNFFHKIFSASYGVFFYIIKTFIPYKLCALYPFPFKTHESISPLFYLAFIGALIFVFLIIMSRRKYPAVFFGLSFYIITVLPVLQLIPVGSCITADRYAYLTTAGVYFAIMASLKDFIKNRKNPAGIREAYSVVFIIYVVLFSLLTFQRSKVFTDSYTLWNDVLKKQPDSWLAYNNTGNLYLDDNDYDKAIEYFNKAIALRPDYPMALYNRGLAYSKKNMLSEALDDYTMSIKYNPDAANVYNNRASVYLIQKEYDKAIADADKAISLSPDLAEAYNNKGTAFYFKKEFEPAMECYKKALALDSNLVEVYFNIGLIYSDKKEYDEEITWYAKAIRINPSYRKAYNNLGIAYSKKEDYEKSILYFSEVIRLYPNYVNAYSGRATSYRKMKNFEAAIADYSKLIEFIPNHPQYYKLRAEVYKDKGDMENFNKDMEKAAALSNSGK